MSKRSLLRLLAAIMCVALIGAACGGNGGTETGDGDGSGNADREIVEAEQGGTLKIAGASDVDYMDPASMYYTLSWFLARGVFRTLVSYPGNTLDLEEQNNLVPDLATDTGTPNDDFSEWTFTLKDGITYGQALGGKDVSGVTGEEIVCEDVKYAMERIFTPSVGAGYPFYFDIIEGADDFKPGGDLSGVTCEDDKTIKFTLTEPAGDWPFRMAMPATSPVPESYASKFDKKDDSNYDANVVATGPYYIAEWTPGEQITLERNENWDPETDEIREAYVDTVDWKLGFENDVGVQKVLDGEYDLAMDVSPQGPVLEKVVTDPELSERLISESEGCTRYLFMNTTIPPFDNQQVREAINWGIDRANIKRVFGGPTTGPIATSILPPGIDGHLPSEEYNPFETPDMAGDQEKAKQMLEEAGADLTVPLKVVGASDAPHDKIFESVRQDLENLGFTNIQEKLPKFPNQYTQFYSVPDSKTAMGTSAGWCKDYQSAFTFLDPLFHGDNILPSGNQNYAELNDDQMNQLIEDASSTPPGEEQTAAWEEANRYATETAVWVPWSWDNSNIIYADTLVNPYYLGFVSHVDWPNVGVTQE